MAGEGRIKGSKNRRTLVREAEEALGLARDGRDMVEPLHAMETVLMHFYRKAMLACLRDAGEAVVDAAMLRAFELAEKVAPYRHPKYAAIKLQGDPAHPLGGPERSSAEIRAEIVQHLINLAPVLELETVPELQDTVLGRIAAAANQQAEGTGAGGHGDR